MPTVCQYFRDMESRVGALASKFVADQVIAEAADLAFQPDTDRLAAFRLLAHAEIEEFLEAKAKEGLVAMSALVNAPGGTVKGQAALFVLASALGATFTLAWPFDSSQFSTEAKKLIRKAEQVVADNNGVKGGSYFLLSIMAGKFPDEIDPSLGASLTSYGSSRGDVAHRSITRVRTLQAPSAEAKTVDDIVKALSAYFDVASV